MTSSESDKTESSDQQEFSAMIENLGERPTELRHSAAAAAPDAAANAARWLLLAALAGIPWAYGGTRPWAIHLLNGWLGIVLVMWGASCAFHRRLPHVPLLLAVSAAALIVQSWGMALAWSINPAASLAMAQRITALVGVACFVSDLARRPAWRKRLWWTMGLAGASVCLLGLAQRLDGANSIFWAKEKSGETFFATFDYHANAGAFINLVWPLVAGVVVSAFQRHASPAGKFISIVLLAVCLSAAFVNASRGAGALAVLLMVVFLGWLLAGLFHARKQKLKPAAALVTTLLVAVIMGGLAFTVGLDETVRRWKLFGREINEQNARLQTARVCLRIIPDTGWLGAGPGTFMTLFPRYQHLGNYAVEENWVYAHQDYLQTVIEWGFLGAGCWTVLALGGLTQSLRARFRNGRWPKRDRTLYFVMLVSLLGVALHAMFDYPLQVASIQLYVAVLLGMLWSCREWKVIHQTQDETEKAVDRGSA
ncbi:MAG TPA: O-antigen ligase family protein [Verrucomicrobiae bacterium]|jgi:hypothetical protein